MGRAKCQQAESRAITPESQRSTAPLTLPMQLSIISAIVLEVWKLEFPTRIRDDYRPANPASLLRPLPPAHGTGHSGAPTRGRRLAAAPGRRREGLEHQRNRVSHRGIPALLRQRLLRARLAVRLARAQHRAAVGLDSGHRERPSRSSTGGWTTARRSGCNAV